MQIPIQQMTRRTTIITEIIGLTPSRHSDHTRLRNYIDYFWQVLSTVNRDHKNKGHRKVQGIQIIKGKL